jgi:peptide-methionine (S)-S-oxide reductase
MKYVTILVFAVVVGLVWAPVPAASDTLTFDLTSHAKQRDIGAEMSQKSIDHLETAYLGGGCFWCVEAVFERIDGIVSAESGYAGGTVENPTYNQVSAGRTGHAEVVRVLYDPAKIQYEAILEVFFKSHDPTTLNRQGADTGTQYRSVVFFDNDMQKEIAERVRRVSQALYDDAIVTEIAPLETFYVAEAYHQDYFEQNPNAGYCRVVITPKLKKLGLDTAETY